MKLNKKLKDPNAKGPLDKFAPIFAAVALAYAVVNGGFSLFDWMGSGARQKTEEDRIEKYIEDQVDEEIKLRFPDTTGLVLPKYMKKKNGATNP